MTEIEPAPNPEPSDPISDLARQRREQAEREAARPSPQFIKSVEQSEVLYYFERSAIPFRLIDVPALDEALRLRYGIQLVGPDFSPLLASIRPNQLVEMEEGERLRRLVRSDGARLMWEDGRFPMRDDFIVIRTIAINFESIAVAVAGVSQVAEVIAKEVIEQLWSLMGSNKKFSDLEPYVQLVAYSTATRLDLSHSSESLLNPKLLEFFEANLLEGKAFGPKMGRVRVSGVPGGDRFSAIVALDDLTLRVRRYSTVTGTAEDSMIQFSITTRSDFRTGRIRVRSELPYEKHVELLTGLFELVH